MSTMTVEVKDWSASRRAELADVPEDMTVAELIGEVREAMSLPRDTPYHLIHDGAKLHRGTTLEQAGVRAESELTIAPEVSAGSERRCSN